MTRMRFFSTWRYAVAILVALNVSCSAGFVMIRHSSPRTSVCCYEQSSSDMHNDLNAAAEKLQVEKTRERLEQDNIQSFLKRKPRKLPYDQARRWVQANLGVDTKDEFDDMVANGNLRTPYIPKQPEKHYTETREWISWEHFLKGIFDDESPSGLRPATGIFD